MTKKEKVNEIMSYYDHRDENNQYVTADGRKYQFPEIPESQCIQKTEREQIEKMVSKGFREPSVKFYKGATPSSWFLAAMEKYRASLKVFLSSDKRKRALFKVLDSDLKDIRDIKCDLRYSDFEWACLTIPRAWLQ